jgi:hypothetical protein
VPVDLYPQAISALEHFRTKLESNNQAELDSVGLTVSAVPEAGRREELRLQNLDA